jgi:hypothetical protein
MATLDMSAKGNHESLLDEIQSEHGDLLYYCEVLSRGKMLRRFWDLLDEVIAFMLDIIRNLQSSRSTVCYIRLML